MAKAKKKGEAGRIAKDTYRHLVRTLVTIRQSCAQGGVDKEEAFSGLLTGAFETLLYCTHQILVSEKALPRHTWLEASKDLDELRIVLESVADMLADCLDQAEPKYSHMTVLVAKDKKRKKHY